MKCSSCCFGPLENMYCSTNQICLKKKLFKQRRDILRLSLICITPYLLIPLLWIIHFIILKGSLSKFAKCIALFYKWYVYFLLFPYGIYSLFEYIFNCKNSNDELDHNKIMYTHRKNTELFHEKEFQSDNFIKNKQDVDEEKIEISVTEIKRDYQLKEIITEIKQDLNEDED